MSGLLGKYSHKLKFLFRCFLGELLTGAPLFPGDEEKKVVEQIYDKCGIPTEADWPGVT
jgi:hypothetical protein